MGELLKYSGLGMVALLEQLFSVIYMTGGDCPQEMKKKPYC